VDGSGQRNLTQTAYFSERDPACSPLGDGIAYSRIGCAGGVYDENHAFSADTCP